MPVDGDFMVTQTGITIKNFVQVIDYVEIRIRHVKLEQVIRNHLSLILCPTKYALLTQ